ncbi:flavin-dependent dehydrogenase [Gelidibacter algens]|uniref:Flavin-dependent dehydrogenase n=1 Tax=Gelidibacter algens TaxID=49280 RepID=A0A327SAE1_9FLAO|nr:NAD(P)/FAD-dependent oxidoreductase [Gelidibacter algens]RAJ25738.1 flavin-dependent dehydrogenase [Gelidibacter algens]
MNTYGNPFDVLIIGGGLAGLSAAIHLQKQGFDVMLIEKNEYPKHKVCGEYISNEVLPYLNYLGVDVFALGAKNITKFEVSSAKSKLIAANLPLGGFGISRYALDEALYLKAKSVGVLFVVDTVMEVQFLDDQFSVETKENGKYTSKIVIGAYGKRTNLDVKLNRNFIKNKSPYLAVKTHVKGDFPEDVVALHNFEGGYCGVSKVEDDSINLCYITNFEAFKKYKDIEEFQEKVLFKNTYLKSIFKNTTAVFESPLTISQISFDRKSPVEEHMLMCGDSAGMIHPLCGNGMSMAIRSAQIASELIIDYLDNKILSRNSLERSYQKAWNKAFKNRLKVGHVVANLFNNTTLTEVSLLALKKIPFLVPFIIKQTHGKPMIIK